MLPAYLLSSVQSYVPQHVYSLYPPLQQSSSSTVYSLILKIGTYESRCQHLWYRRRKPNVHKKHHAPYQDTMLKSYQKPSTCPLTILVILFLPPSHSYSLLLPIPPFRIFFSFSVSTLSFSVPSNSNFLSKR